MTQVGTVQSIGNGLFVCDGQKLSFEDLVFQVQMECVNKVDQEFAAKFSEVKARNQKIKDINDIMAMLRNHEPGKDDSVQLNGGDLTKWREFYNNYVKTGIVDDPGIGWDGKFVKKEYDNFMENAKAVQSDLNSETELDMMTLNKMANQRNSYIQLCTSLLEKISQVRSKAASNL